MRTAKEIKQEIKNKLWDGPITEDELKRSLDISSSEVEQFEAVLYHGLAATGEVIWTGQNPDRCQMRASPKRGQPPGGARPGSGRHPLEEDEPTERHTVTAPASVWRTIEALGEGNRSKGTRRLLEMMQA